MSLALTHRISSYLLLLLFVGAGSTTSYGQDTVTGAFEGTVTGSQTGSPVEGAAVEIINLETGGVILKQTDSRGRFYQGLLAPGIYKIRISMAGFQTRETLQRLNVSRTGEVVPVPVTLDPATAPPPPATTSVAEAEIRAGINTTDARRSGAFPEDEVTALPLGATTLTRTFDELALLLPGVAPPPQTTGSVAGPGVGAGVGSAGQFAVNGLRSRANNFTVDGSDNNDEDIGVRRQGFVALIPQPIESIKEYQAITLLAPAQFGRNLGAQVNAVSKSGGSETHGTVYGYFNSSQLNARNFFDRTGDGASTPLRTGSGQPVLFDGQPVMVRNGSGGKDSFTFGQAGLTLGGPLRRKGMFYFLSAEGQLINATQEESFAVPTVEQRGAFGSGATGIFLNPIPLPDQPKLTSTIPVSRNGSAVFNLFPFPNNPQGVYGLNTFTQELPASGRGLVLSGKFDGNFKTRGRQQSVTARYNFSNDRRDIPATGEAIFSTLRPRVRTQNLSIFLNSELSGPNSSRPVFNQARLSYGRTRLDFREVRDRQLLIPSGRFPNAPFLLNAPLQLNSTTPSAPGIANAGPVLYRTPSDIRTVEEEIGTVGQVIIAGFSPLGVDVYNFPQQRVNNTYQLADVLTWRVGNHSLAFGTDHRRTELNSDLPRNARPLVTFNGGPRLIVNPENGTLRFPTVLDPNPVLRPTDLAAFGAASNFFLTLNTTDNDSKLSLRFYQLNFFAQDEWRLRPDLSLAYGLRYEYNTPPRELNRRIERTFNDQALNLAPGLRSFIEGRTEIFDPDRNNFAPRVSLAYSPKLLGKDLVTVVRAGYGLFYDQILGAVVSQSRNVYPTFLPLNFGGGAFGSSGQFPLSFFNPARTLVVIPNGSLIPILQPGSLTRLNPNLPLDCLLKLVNSGFPSALGATLPSRRLETPTAHHYNLTVEQQLGQNLAVSAAYVGTQGRHLLRFTTPNLGPGANLVLTSFEVLQRDLNFPSVRGRLNAPVRPVPGIGAINRFETTAESRYDSLQLQVRGRFRQSLQYQAAYTLSKASDDVSDVFDLAGAFVLPQDSLNLAAERGLANFDARHRFVYNFTYDLSALSDSLRTWRRLVSGLQVASTGQFQTGQPFTVNSVFDVNLDGNLTDRLDTMTGLAVTGDRRQPLRLTTDNPLSLLAPFGRDGRVGRNTFHAGSVLELNLAVIKSFATFGQQQLNLRVDFFNFINRANFGVPVRLLEAPGFGQAVSTVTPGRRIQFAVKYVF